MKSIAILIALLSASGDHYQTNAIRLTQSDIEDDVVDSEMEAIMQSNSESADLEVEEVEEKQNDKKEEKKKPKDRKFEEVNNLMTKYDNAEKRVKWLHSPEYAQ